MASGYIEQRNGGFYITGTRIPLEAIWCAFQQGESPETIRRNFSVLNLEQVYGAITSYLANKASVDISLAESEKQWDAFNQENPLPAALRAKLDRARQEPLVNRS